MDKAKRVRDDAQQWGNNAQNWGNDAAHRVGSELNGGYQVVKDRYGLQSTTQPSNNGYTCLLYLFAILLPPIPVFLKTGCGIQIIINIILCALSWIPGIIHAIYILIST